MENQEANSLQDDFQENSMTCYHSIDKISRFDLDYVYTMSFIRLEVSNWFGL